MRNVVKVRLYPSQNQKQALASGFGSVRWVWNYCLELNNKAYQQTGKGISALELKQELPRLKKQKETLWLKETYSQCLQQSVLNLGKAFVNFFEGRAKFPRFKSRYGKQSLQYPQNVLIVDNSLQFPVLGKIKANIHRRVEGKIKTVSITQNRTGKYYASILFDDGLPEPYPPAPLGKEGTKEGIGKAVGIDLGLTHFAIASDGSKYENPRHLLKHGRNLKHKQQKLFRKQKASNSRAKARRLVARAHEKISNARQDFLHKLSRQIINENQVIIAEDLNIKGMEGMVRNHTHSHPLPGGELEGWVSDCGWGTFQNFLEYKAKRDGKIYLEIHRWFPSSKTCNVCLNIVESLPLDLRSWDCPKCGTDHDREINAAINIREEGLRVISCGTRETADGGSVRSGRGRKSTTRQFPLKLESTHQCSP